MNFLETQEFSIIQPVGVKVIAFYIIYSDLEKNIPLCRLEKIDYMDNIVEGKTERRFTVLENRDKLLDIILLSLTKQKCDIVFARLRDGILEYTDKTITAKYADTYNVEEEEQEYRFRFNPINQIVIIDTDSGEQILPVIERSIDNAAYKMGKYKLLKGKRYIVMELTVEPK